MNKAKEIKKEAREATKEKLTKAAETTADKSIPASEAIGQVADMIRKEYEASADYTKCRAKRKKDVAERLHKMRMESKLKQQEVAEKTGINAITLSGYEIAKNEPNMEALVRLADVYGITLDYLMCRTNDEEEKE